VARDAQPATLNNSSRSLPAALLGPAQSKPSFKIASANRFGCRIAAER